MFLKDVSYAHESFDKKYSKNIDTVKCYNLKGLFSVLMYFKNAIYSFDAKLKFQQPLLQSSVSHDPSEIILICRFSA